jgi:tetracycline resistance efflux pump
MEHYGIISLIPAACVLVIALISKRTLEALIGGTLIGFIIWKKTAFFGGFADTALKVMGDGTIGWIILVCGLFGSLIALLIRSGGAIAFGNFLITFIKNRKSALITTWILGLVIFIDDYLNALTVSSSMKKVTDKFKISREMLAYVVDSTAAPVCVLIPFSTWAVYSGALLESSGAAEKGQGLSVYISAIPFMFYAWVAVILVPLVALGIVPSIFSMKKAEARANEEHTSNNGESKEQIIGEVTTELLTPDNEIAPGAKENPKLYNFLIPIILLITATIYFEIDIFKGVLVAISVSIVMFSAQKIMTFSDIFDTLIEGFKTMILPLAIVVSSFMLIEVNNGLGLTSYVIETVKPLMSGAFLPAVAFLALSIITFSTGSFWGVYAVSFPIIIPLAQAMNTNLPLAIGAVISAGALGSHACFYGDATVLSAAGSGCSNMDHALTQIPYAIIAAVIAFVFFIVAGIAM